MKRHATNLMNGVAALVFANLLSVNANAQGASRQTSLISPVGTWRGTSKCVVQPSACNDESVVYRITLANRGDSASIDARKIVQGQEQEMGILGCRWVATNEQLTCTIPRGVWQFNIRSDSLIGELRLNNNTKFRDVRTARAK